MSSEHPIGLKTLKDVRLVLPAIYSKASAKTLAAALGKVEKLTGKKLSQLPADENAWYQASRSIIWAGAFRGLTPGDQEEAFETWVKKIAAIIRRAHAHVAVPVIVADESRAWDQIVQYATDVENTVDDQGALILPNMFSMSMTNLRNRCRSVHPSELTTETAHQALASCRADKAASFRNAINAFNKLVCMQNRHPAIAHLLPNVPIGPLPFLRDSPLDWSRFSERFLASRDRAISRAVQPDRHQRRDRFNGQLGASKLANWLESGLPRWCEKHGIDVESNELLLPGPAGVLSRQSFNRVWNRSVARLGVPGLKPHMMRHVLATIWLAANPGDYATVAAFLCDKVSTVEKFYARGEGAAAAKLFADALEALDPTLGSFLKRS